jgi:hypothetical protein
MACRSGYISALHGRLHTGWLRSSFSSCSQSTGHLVAGRWDADERNEILELGLVDEFWQTDISAAAFRDHYASIGPCETSSDAQTYTLTCERPASSSLWDRVYPALHAQQMTAPVSRASLVLRRTDLHAMRMALTVRVAPIVSRSQGSSAPPRASAPCSKGSPSSNTPGR